MTEKRDKTREIINFDLLNSSLEGTNLIEASAGTGKTYTIVGLFLRLILEKRFGVDEILVVTYTVAATEELRDRIRRKLREALEAFSSGGSRDAFLKEMLRKISDTREAIRLLQYALHDFDQAPIFTIHGFCQRTLHERAFESGSLFDTELAPDQEANFMEEIVRDFWRRHFYQASVEFVSYAQGQKYNPDFFLKLLKKRVPDLKIIPEADPADFTLLETFRQEFMRLKEAWRKVREQVLEKLSDPGLNKTYYKNPSLLGEAMDEYLAGESPRFPLFPELEKFTTAELVKRTKQKQTTPKHPYFDLCEEYRHKASDLQVQMDKHLLFLKREAFRYMEKELPSRKQRRNIQSFEDLLTRLRDSLEKAGGDDLSSTIRKKYRAALIDEFQDTDPVQYAIFQKVFSKEGAILFLIGDPKQAIYSFRGADLFAYMKASDLVDFPYTLTRNWRSEPELITAVNAIFDNGKNPFLYQEIRFEPASPKEENEQALLTIHGKPEEPFHLWLLDPEKISEPNKPLNKGQARNLISAAVAGEIARLLHLGLEGKALIGENPLREADMVVLVRTNREARLIQKALAGLNIQSVLHSTGNLFETEEAMEVTRILASIAEPGQEQLLRVALATDILGVDGETIDILKQDETGWENWLSKFKEYYDLWQRRGFIQMFRYFLLREKVRTRLLSLPDGERRLTNILHLSEVLQQESMERKLGVVGLLKWLVRQRDPQAPRLEEHQLRLESDANAVKIVTIHKSKGLEYPVVFCPFNWDGSRIEEGESFTFHDEEDDCRLNLVLNPEGHPQRALAEKELLAENLRLLYVALTRAKNRCYLVWGRLKEGETSSIAYVLHPPQYRQGNIVEVTGENFAAMTDEEIRQDLQTLAGMADGTIRLDDLPPAIQGETLRLPAGAKEDLTGRKFSISVDRDWQVASFSHLLSGFKRETEATQGTGLDIPDHDEDRSPKDALAVEAEPSSIFAFPKGARAGIFLHDILEHLDFTEKDILVVGDLVAAKLREYGFEQKWQETLCRMIERLLKVPLDSPPNRLILSRIEKKDRLSELEFYFPLQSITPQKLQGIFARYMGLSFSDKFPAQIEKLDFRPARGFMKGFMDLVFHFQGRFYLVDWKSNFLGPHVEDYNSHRLAEDMEDNFYILQYHLYTLALHQYLKKKIPEYSYGKHFGGVFYVYLRGVNPEIGPDFGIYRDLPSEDLIEALSDNLIKKFDDG